MNFKRELIRQIIHASGIFFIFLENFFSLPFLLTTAMFATISGELIFQLDKRRYIPLFSKILRSCRRDVNEKGFIYFFLGVSLTLLIFGFNMAITNAAIIILVLGDAASTLVGQKFGKNKLPYNSLKSWQGSISFCLVGFLGAWTQLPPEIAILGAISGAIAEAYSPVDDNISIPLVCGSVIAVLDYFI